MLRAIIRNACLLLLPVLTTPACTTTLFNSDSSAAQTPASQAVASPRSLPTESVPTAVVPTTRPTAKPTVGPTATPVPEFSVPEAEFEDLSAYRSAMLPQFRTDIDQIAAAGATRYDLDVSIDAESFAAESDFRLGGIEHVRYTNTEEVPLSEIVFMLYPNLPSFGGKLQVEQAFVAGQRVEPYLEAGGVTLGVPLPTPLLPGETVDVSLHFETIVSSQAQSGYNIFSFSNDTAALAGFYPAVALYNDQGWNLDLPPAYGDATYLDTSLYQVRLTVPENMVVAASGNLVDSVSNGDGSKTLWLASGPMRDFYLVMRADFQVLSETVAGTIVNSYYPPQLEPGAKLALRSARPTPAGMK